MIPLAFVAAFAAAERVPLVYAPAPVANPLKGLVPYAAVDADGFPHTLEYDYLPLGAVVVGAGKYDWAPLEKLVGAIAGRGRQAVLRFYMEYPGKFDGIPAYLKAGGLKVHRYKNTNTAPSPPADVETPDYGDQNLRACLKDFIAAFGKKYDGDPRIGFLTAGLLGTWGEWHTYPREDLWASKTVQSEVLDAYAAAFKVTPVLLRYPAGPKAYAQAENASRPFGYHDDSFAWATLPTGKKADDWFYLPALKAAGPAAVEKWKTQPIGGEIRPEAWGKVFDSKPGNKMIQDFATCVKETHATWLMDSGMFEKKQPADRRKRAEDQARRMGYEFHAPGATVAVNGAKVDVALEIENRGVAPFYYGWKAEYALLATGKPIKVFPGSGALTGLLPGDPARVWAESLPLAGVPAGPYAVAVRVPNTMPNGRPVRFANTGQDADAAGWLTIGTVTVP